MFRNLLVLAIICTVSNVAYTATDTNYRLNTPIVPSAYELLITPFFDTNDGTAFTFAGEVLIQFTTTAVTNQIKLHSKDLNFTAANIQVINISRQNAAIALNATNPLEFDTQYTFAFINLLEDLVPGSLYSVKITYAGPIREDLNGFYRNYYLENGVKKWLGATQMEPTHAREAFPCFDEPALKATFTIHIDRPSHYKNSLSNSKMQTSVDLGNGYVRETFYPTPKMPTYLVAFLVSEYEASQYSINGTREFGIYARPEAKNQTVYPFEFGMKVVNELGNYFDIDYYSTNEYIKLDHVAIPDFRAGAMENWGLVKYREALLLYDPETTAPYFRYRIAQILAHETTHMWFGNLVTCHWWSNTWLNEGFANYFQDYISDLIEPELGSANLLVTSSVYTAYDSDDDVDAPPINNNNVNSPAEISAHFGRITYQKAGSIIRMIHHLIENDAFKFGLHTYLRNNSFGSGYPELLYAALNEGVSRYNSLAAYPNANIADVMGSWITQAGHPILQVDIDYTADTLTLTQKRFYTNESQSSNEIYKIPITYTTGLNPNFENTKPAFIMDTKTYVITNANITNDHQWIIFNLQETGFYRVNYDDHTWELIATALKGDGHNAIHHLNRAKIINDLFAFLYADVADFSLLHNVLEFLSEETEYSVWYAALKGFKELRNSYLAHSDVLPTIDAYILRFLSLGIDKFGYAEKSTESFEDLRNREQILEFACKLNHDGCLEYALVLFNALKHNGTEISPSLRPVAYTTGLRYGNGEDYDFLWTRMTTTNVASEVTVIGEALGHTADQEKIKSYLVAMEVENSPIKTQDQTVPLSSVLSNYSNLNLVMDELTNNVDLWNTIYDGLDTPLRLIASVLHTENDFNEFEAFLSQCSQCTEAEKISARTTMEQSKSTKSWADSHKAVVLSTLRSNSNTVMPSILMIVLSLALFFTKY